MSYHRSHTQFDRAQWHQGLLLVLWVVQVTLTIPLLGVFAWRLTITTEKKPILPVEVAWESANLVLAVVSMASMAFEIFRVANETLTPWQMMLSHIVKLSVGVVVLVLDVVVFYRHLDSTYSLVGISLVSAFLIAASIPAVYAVRTYRRVTNVDEYLYTANTKPFGFYSGDEDFGSSSSSSLRRLSLIDARRFSASSIRQSSSGHLEPLSNRPSNDSDYSSGVLTSPPPYSPVTGSSEHFLSSPSTLTRSQPIYNHQRDTQFDNYIVSRASLLRPYDSPSSRDELLTPLSSSLLVSSPLAATGLGEYRSQSVRQMQSSSATLGYDSVLASRSRARAASAGTRPSWEGVTALGAVPEVEADDSEGGKLAKGQVVQETTQEIPLGEIKAK